jgi:hypothetical protein
VTHFVPNELTAVDGGRTISLWKAPDLAASAARLWLSKAKRSGCLSRESVLLRDHFGAIELTKIFEARALLDSVAQRIEAGTGSVANLAGGGIPGIWTPVG